MLRKYHLIVFWGGMNWRIIYLSRFLKFRAKDRSSSNFLRWKRSAFTLRNRQCHCFLYLNNSEYEFFLLCKVQVFVMVSFLLSEKLRFLLNILKDLLNLYYKNKCEAELKNFLLSEVSIATAWYRPILVASEIPWNRIWHFDFAEIKGQASVFSLKLISVLITQKDYLFCFI